MPNQRLKGERKLQKKYNKTVAENGKKTVATQLSKNYQKTIEKLSP